MRMDWIPASAAAFVTGAMALTFGSLMLPSGSSTADTLQVARTEDGRWLAAAVIFFIASVALTLGLPAAMSLFDRRGRTLGMVSAVVLAVGFLGTAGYSMLIVFFRAIALETTLTGAQLDDAVHEAGLTVFLYGWIAGFYLGELLLAIALLRAGTIQKWVPLVLIAHVATLLVSSFLPHSISSALVLLVAVGFAGVAIEAVTRDAEQRKALPVGL
ncbi:hypothetical protein GCM10009844_04730 [Nocardioides koreensis]|uniref:DUF4386 domain-containing protein n=1 Tax=Nocardioides koreensis TaxID=433651 RepID=A0ABN2Z6J1_9ACTN